MMGMTDAAVLTIMGLILAVLFAAAWLAWCDARRIK